MSTASMRVLAEGADIANADIAKVEPPSMEFASTGNANGGGPRANRTGAHLPIAPDAIPVGFDASRPSA